MKDQNVPVLMPDAGRKKTVQKNTVQKKSLSLLKGIFKFDPMIIV